MKAYLKNKKREKELSSAKRLTTNQSAGKKEVIFNDLVTMPFSLDIGTAHNVIPRSIVHELQQLDSSVVLKKLDPPVKGKAVGGAYMACSESVELDVGMHTVAGTVNIRGLICIMAETDEDEFLLGSQTLELMLTSNWLT
ncbi:hypothetical protein PI124_g15548 [Phytophthora idaei]|nr:hypothetical protein PI125_g15521 [Phytophthora idaei]KAG3143623.1 hypothetical protein PI126_g14534 [Phytophthora idaei]KAG3239522.1 hypothetical protein PI124_g15548 [Phytophthora idaei]